MEHTRHIQLIQTAVLLVISALLLQSQALAGTPADAVPAKITGELTILYADDFKNRRAELQFFIEEKQSKKHYRLQFDGNPPGHLRTGEVITVQGKAKGKKVYLAADGVESNGRTLAPSVATVSGSQHTIVMLADFNDANVSCSVNAVRDLMFTDPTGQSVDDFYQETSLGLVSISGDVVGRYTINYSSTDACDPNGWAAAVEAEAQVSGVDLSLYDRKIYVLPESNTCGWAGLGSLGGNPSYSWILRCNNEAVYGHELGHNIGMNHASTLSNEYGDTTDVMGYSSDGMKQLNGPHQDQMGWRSPDKIVPVTQGGYYDIAPLELDTAQALAPQVLKIAKPDSGETYYLSYRQPIGFDSNLSAAITERLHVHLYNGNGGRTTLLSTLPVGASFVDSINDITVTHISHTPDYTTVQVQLDESTATCTPMAPVVSLSPSSQSANGGSTLNYAISITNNDDIACPNSSFTLNNNLPTGWTGTVSPSSLSLAPGQTVTATLSATSATNAIANTYSVGVNVTDSSEASHSAAGNASYTVLAACTPAIPGLGLSPGSQSGEPGETLTYSVSLVNNDSPVCSASTFSLTGILPGWSGSLSPDTLTLSPGQSSTASWQVTSPGTADPGSYALQIQASDTHETVHDASRSASYVVNETAQSDTSSPTAPTGLTASGNTRQVSLSWNPSNDNVGVVGYRIYRDGDVIATTSVTGYADRDGVSNVMYEYSVDAYDAADNASVRSNTVTAEKAKAEVKGKGKGRRK